MANSSEETFAEVKDFITLIDSLRDIGVHHQISLPRIAVVGSQSSGKSSVLESIIGIDCLPRGKGVCTRRPIELRLSKSEEGTWASFPNVDPDKRFHDLKGVQEEIQNQTNKVAGENKGIVDDPIVVRIHGPSCPNLTLIDLPGITRVPLKNSDQTVDIENLTKSMAYRYIADKRTVILAVIAGNQDISTSDGLHMAKHVDSAGLRTIGVITKVDIMDKGTNAVGMVTGADVNLKLGFVAVKNRSQEEIEACVSVTDALYQEREWFRQDSVYNKLDEGYLGTSSLVKKLTGILLSHIQLFLPQILEEIRQKKNEMVIAKRTLGEALPTNTTSINQYLYGCLMTFSERVNSSITGKYDSHWNPDDFKGPSAGSQIRDVFDDFLEPRGRLALSLDANPLAIPDEDIQRSITMYGRDESLFGLHSADALKFLLLPKLESMIAPSIECVGMCSEVLSDVCKQASIRIFGRFPKLMDVIDQCTGSLLSDEYENTKKIVESFVMFQTSYLYTAVQMGNLTDDTVKSQNANPPLQNNRSGLSDRLISGFGQLRGKTISPLGVVPGSHVSHNSTDISNDTVDYKAPEPFSTTGRISEYNAIRNKLYSYFSLVSSQVRDGVPRAIGYFLVKSFASKLHFHLHSHLMEDPNCVSALEESPDTVKKRQVVAEQLTVLDKALKLLNQKLATSYNRNIVHVHGNDDDSGFQQFQAMGSIEHGTVSRINAQCALVRGASYDRAGASFANSENNGPSYPDHENEIDRKVSDNGLNNVGGNSRRSSNRNTLDARGGLLNKKLGAQRNPLFED